MRVWLAALLAVPLLAQAQERPADFPYGAPVFPEGAASHYRVVLPAFVYRGAARRDLGDLRIFNAAGEPVPYAFLPRKIAEAPASLIALKIFPLYGSAGKGLEDTVVSVQRSTGGTIVSISAGPGAPAGRRLLGYVLDASDVKAAKQAVVLSWKAAAGFSGEARVEGSDDLKRWSLVAAGAPILLLEHAGARLERNRVELAGTHAKYLRVSFGGVPSRFELKQARVELKPERPEPAREWLSLAGQEGRTKGELLFDSGGNFPVDRVRLSLPQLNTVAQVQFLVRDRAEDPWRPLSYATTYRLARDGGEVKSPDASVPLASDRYWLLKVDQKGGGFGAGEVRLELGWVPGEVVFAARGEPPFLIAYGARSAKPGALPVSAVLPRSGDADAAVASPARVGELTDASHPAPSLLSDPAGFVRDLAAHRDAKKWLLWLALVVGVALLGWMAMRLLRDLGERKPR